MTGGPARGSPAPALPFAVEAPGMRKNYYLILGVPADAAAEAIRSAYRELAKRFHPDRGGPSGEGSFREIAEAYRVLSDEARRARYDRELRRGIAPAPPPPSTDAPEPLVSEPVPVSGRPESVRPSFDALFERIARNFTSWDLPKSEHAEPLDFELILSPEEAARGVVIPFTVPVFRPCPWCAGSGRDGGLPCAPCEQEGRLVDEQVVRVRVPAGVRPESVLEISLEPLGVRNLWLRVHVRVGRH